MESGSRRNRKKRDSVFPCAEKGGDFSFFGKGKEGKNCRF